MSGVAVTVVAAVIVLLGAVGWVVSTESGTTWLVSRLQSIAGPGVTFGTNTGTLREGISVRDIQVVVDSNEASIDLISLRLNLPALLRGLVEFEELSISEIEYRQGEPTTASPEAAGFSLPVDIRIARGSIQRISFVTPDNEFLADFTSFAAEASGNRIALQDVSTEIDDFQLQGAGEFRFEPEVTLAIAFDWASDIGGLNYEGGGTAEGTLSSLTVAHELRSPVEIALTGTVVFEGAPSVDVLLSWTDLAWPEIDDVRSSEGEMNVSGWIDSFDFEGTGQLETDLIDGAYEAEGSGSPTELFFDELALTTASGRIMADGQVALDPLSWALVIDAEDVNPAVALEEWPGIISGSGEFSGQADPFEWSLADASVSGTLREQPFSAMGTVASRAAETWQLDSVNVLVGDNRIDIDGSIADDLDLEVFVNAPEIEDLWPDASGELNVDGRIGGTIDAPNLQGTARIQQLIYRDYALETLMVEGNATLVDDAPLNVEIQATNLVSGNIDAKSLIASVSGTASEHSLDIDLESEVGYGQAHAIGSWSPEGWIGRVDAVQIDQPQVGSWVLTRPAEISFLTNILAVRPLCVRQQQSEVCGTAQIGTDEDFVDATITSFNLRNLQAFLPDIYSVDGLVNGEMSLRDPLGEVEGRVELSGGTTLFQLQEADTLPLEIPLERFDIEALLEGEQLDFELELIGSDNARISLNADVDDLRTDDPILDADIVGELPDVAMLSILSPDVNDVSGQATIAMSISGSVRSPQLQGQAEWTNGSLLVPRWGFRVEDIEASAFSADGSVLKFSATGAAGEGEIILDGTTDFRMESWPTQLTVRGDSLQAVRTSDTEIYVSPDLEIDVALPAINVSGSILIPNADVQLDEVPAQAVVPSADAVVHGSSVQAAPRPLDVSADLRVILGDGVRYSGAGLEVDLIGEIGLSYESGRSAVAMGTVTMLGGYQAYGQNLTLERGELLFAGPLDNPGLDVRAVRVIDPITVGVQLAGTVSAPTTQIFSSPAMSEADALSYLILGRPLSASDDEETATLEGAALSMGLRQALPAIQQVGQSLGLDELTVRTTAADTGELMAGKQITPRIYMRYTYGIFNRIGGLLMQLRLTDRFSLETRSGDYRSMDLIYTVESD